MSDLFNQAIQLPTANAIKKKIGVNKTIYFMLPLLGYSIKTWGPNMLGAYLSADPAIDVDVERPLFVVYKHEPDNPEWRQLEDALDSIPECVGSYLAADDQLLVYVFEIAERFEDDYYNFLSGKYSQFSAEAQHRCLHAQKTDGEKKLIEKIFKRDPGLGAKMADSLRVNRSEWDSSYEVWDAVNQRDHFKLNNFLKLF